MLSHSVYSGAMTNSLSGEIPKAFCNMRKLKSLYVVQYDALINGEHACLADGLQQNARGKQAAVCVSSQILSCGSSSHNIAIEDPSQHALEK